MYKIDEFCAILAKRFFMEEAFFAGFVDANFAFLSFPSFRHHRIPKVFFSFFSEIRSRRPPSSPVFSFFSRVTPRFLEG